MAFRKQAKITEAAPVQAVSEWSVADLSALYADQRSSLTQQARRILRSDADAAEIVQEAFLKFILAAPELDSRDRALAYLRTTVNNLCLNQIRATGSRPNLVAIDTDASQERLDELALEAHIPFDTTLAAAEDASIIREALSRLSSDQRTALVMWEMEGRTTEEIAAAIGTTPANVRHVVARSRASFVRILSEWVIDEQTGATALDALSTSYKKATELAKKSSKVALSLLIVLVAFLGFNSVTGHETTINLICNGTLSFIRNPDQWALLKQDPAGLAKPATEECLRYDSPVKSIQRIASQDVEMRGKTLRKDDRVRWFISSANRDPDAFPNPARFDITRHPNQHVAFGSGTHHCLGATLARVEGQEVFKALAERFPNLQAQTDNLEYQPSITFRSLKSLPVTWH